MSVLALTLGLGMFALGGYLGHRNRILKKRLADAKYEIEYHMHWKACDARDEGLGIISRHDINMYRGAGLIPKDDYSKSEDSRFTVGAVLVVRYTLSAPLARYSISPPSMHTLAAFYRVEECNGAAVRLKLVASQVAAEVAAGPPESVAAFIRPCEMLDRFRWPTDDEQIWYAAKMRAMTMLTTMMDNIPLRTVESECTTTSTDTSPT